MNHRELVDTKGLFKRAIGILLSVALLLSAGRIGSLSVQADRPIPSATAGQTAGHTAGHTAGQTAGHTAPADPRREAASRLCEGLLSCDMAIDLTDCAIPAAEIGALYASVLYDDPALFHVALRLSYATEAVRQNGKKPLSDKDNGASTIVIVTTVYPTYTLTGAALAEARTLYRATIAGILADMEAAFGGHTPCEAAIALYLHDTLADRYAYDTRSPGTAAETATPGETAPNADAYRLFRDGVGICQAYTLAYMALCRAAGLEACFVSSPAMNHAWNHVRIDGVWYHVDVTRDDPITAPGEAVVTHTRLLRTDAGMASMGYGGFSCPAGHACTDDRYERAVPPRAAPLDAPTALDTDRQPAAMTPETTDTAPPLEGFERALIPVVMGKTVIFVGVDRGEIMVNAWLRYGGFCGEMPVLADAQRMLHAITAAPAEVVSGVYLTPDGVWLTAPGDLDGDGALTPADLLCIHDTTLPEAWREGVRLAVAGAPPSIA